MPGPEAPQQLPLPSPAATGVKRAHDVQTPESERPPKKARTEPDHDATLDLALDHLRMDPATHPLYSRNADVVFNKALGNDTFQELIGTQINKILAVADTKKAALDKWQYRKLRRQLATISAQRILDALGASLNESFHFANAMEKLEVERDADGYKVSFTVKPVMQLDDDTTEGGNSESTKQGDVKVQANGSVVYESPETVQESEGESSEGSSDESGSGSGSEDESEDDSEDGGGNPANSPSGDH